MPAGPWASARGFLLDRPLRDGYKGDTLSLGESCMAEGDSFAHFIRRIRAGDAEAAAQLLRDYESAIRLEVRLRLRDPRLRRLFDSMDICQSVLGSFFVRAAAGQYDLDQPEQLLKLLVAMVRNKLAYHARRNQTRGRDYRRNQAIDPDQWQVAAADPSPSQIVAGRDLLQAFRQRLTEDERRLADLRAQGQGWQAYRCAARLGPSAGDS
jgi:DNA-directed RNA polymerase specialized sigma24 family protein